MVSVAIAAFIIFIVCVFLLPLIIEIFLMFVEIALVFIGLAFDILITFLGLVFTIVFSLLSAIFDLIIGIVCILTDIFLPFKTREKLSERISERYHALKNLALYNSKRLLKDRKTMGIILGVGMLLVTVAIAATVKLLYIPR